MTATLPVVHRGDACRVQDRVSDEGLPKCVEVLPLFHEANSRVSGQTAQGDSHLYGGALRPRVEENAGTDMV